MSWIKLTLPRRDRSSPDVEKMIDWYQAYYRGESVTRGTVRAWGQDYPYPAGLVQQSECARIPVLNKTAPLLTYCGEVLMPEERPNDGLGGTARFSLQHLAGAYCGLCVNEMSNTWGSHKMKPALGGDDTVLARVRYAFLPCWQWADDA